MLCINERLEDKYCILNKYAETKTSLIYEVSDHSRTPKILKVAKYLDTQINQQIKNEAKYLARIHHPMVPQLYDKFIYADKYDCIVMEKMPGITLSEMVERKKAFLLWSDIIAITEQLVELLLYFHQLKRPIMLLDLKPSNILITESYSIYIVDFGSATEVGSELQNISLGTIGFAAPEQFEVGQASLQSDLFSLGAILFYLISGGKNVYTASIEEAVIIPNIPRSYLKMVERLTQMNLNNRYQSITEVAAVFHNIKMSRTDKVVNYFQKLVSLRK